MENHTFAFDDFIRTVDSEHRAFVNHQHRMFIQYGCEVKGKIAKSGYLVSYLLDKKTIFNYVFRKKGLFIRVYADHLGDYIELLDTLPDGLIQTIHAAPTCKRLVNPDTCNSKCAMGYDFFFRGEHFQKCRNNAFLFLLCEENNPWIETVLKKELEARYNLQVST